MIDKEAATNPTKPNIFNPPVKEEANDPSNHPDKGTESHHAPSADGKAAGRGGTNPVEKRITGKTSRDTTYFDH